MATANAVDNDAILKALLKGPKTRQQLGASATRYRLDKLVADKFIRRAGEAKVGSARKAVTYELMARGRKRAEKL